MKIKSIFIYNILYISYLNATEGCNILSYTHDNKPKVFKIREDIPKYRKINITKKLSSFTLKYENQEIKIERAIEKSNHTCPPFCIQPMNIKGVKTVGELEVLDFIKGLKGKEARLFIDIRENREYKKHTIPRAINIPSHMLKNGSKYKKEVLTILGGKKNNNRWVFKFVPYLLIFGQGSDDSRTSNVIKTLMELSYPKEKIYYYRAGVNGWKNLGLTLY